MTDSANSPEVLEFGHVQQEPWIPSSAKVVTPPKSPHPFAGGKREARLRVGARDGGRGGGWVADADGPAGPAVAVGRRDALRGHGGYGRSRRRRVRPDDGHHLIGPADDDRGRRDPDQQGLDRRQAGGPGPVRAGSR